MICRKVATRRPIALTQIGCAFLAPRAKAHLCIVAGATVAQPQKGFVHERRIEERILGFDEACTTASLTYSKGAVGILFDFAQAFPSLAQAWMSLVLHKIAMP